MTEGDITLSSSAVYSRLPDIIPRSIAGETILVPVRGELAHLDRIFSLNPLGEFIWQALDGSNSLADISAGIVDNFDVDRETAMRDLVEFVADLEDAGLATASIRQK